MCIKKEQTSYTTLVSDSFGNEQEKGTYEVAFRRWLVRELEEDRMTVSEAIDRFNFNPANGRFLIREWRKKYAPEMVLSLPLMAEKERQKVADLQKRLQQAEQQLEHAQMKNIALETLIDVAEDKLKISIRKKPGAKQ
jgi:hypothetical protein